MAYKIGLCEGRHDIPDVADYFFGEIPVDKVTDFRWMEETAFGKLEGLYESGELGDSAIDIYVTGLTPALIAALNACRRANTNPALYHYDRATGSYIPQTIY